MRTLTIDEVIAIVKQTPEQTIFDWKFDFVVPDDDSKRGEFLKDLAAIANAADRSYGFVMYGVDPKREDPVVGITQSYDDAKLQQLVRGKIDPLPEFLYYEVSAGARLVGVLQVAPTRRRPHIIAVDLGKVRRGQIVIRRGSSTDGVTIADLQEFFYGETSGYFPAILQRLNAVAERHSATAAHLRELRLGEDRTRRDIGDVMGMPRRTDDEH